MTITHSTLSSTPNVSSPELGYIMTLSLGGTNYKIFAYFEDTNGTKTYLPATIDACAREKIRDLTWNLFNAHDCRRKSLNISPYHIKGIEAQGLITTDHTMISHDFTIAPFSPPSLVNQIVNSLSRCGHPMQKSAIKAQDIWTTLEEVIRQEMTLIHNPSSNSVRMDAITTTPASLQPPSLNSTPSSLLTTPESIPLSSSSPISHSPSLQTSSLQTQAPSYRPPLHSVDIDLSSLDYHRKDWYAHIPPRQKLRIIQDILQARTPGGGIYAKVWNHFAQQCQPPTVPIHLLEQEKNHLIAICQTLPSQIPQEIRHEADLIIEDFYRHFPEQQLRNQITALLRKDFACKDLLFQRLLEQAIAEGVIIEKWDREWAKYHYLDNTRRFVQALCGWLDNN